MPLTETYIGDIFIKGKRRTLYLVTTTGPASYVQGGFTYTFLNGRYIDAVLSLANNGGFLTNRDDASISANVLTIKPLSFQYTCGATGKADETAAGIALNAITFSAILVTH